MLRDPILDPIGAGWTKEGAEPRVPVGAVLEISDGTNSGFCRFFVVDAAAFTEEIELNPSVLLESGFSRDAEDNTGVHVAINDGEREIRAAVPGTDTGTVRVALKTLIGHTSGFVLPTTQATFKVKRVADGRGGSWRCRDSSPRPWPGCTWPCP